MVRELARQVWAEPRVADPPRRVWRDWVIVGVLVAAAIVEVIVRDDLGWKPWALLFGVPPVFTVLWRRTEPLVVVAIAFAFHGASEAVTLFGAERSAMLNSTIWLLLLPYALFRWGSGRQAAYGLAVMALVHVPNGSGVADTIVDAVFASVFFLLPATLGVAVRYRTASKLREVDQVKLREREQLARELHDTVAHHVSAIVIQAQAGRAVGVTNPGAAIDVLEVIEAEASRTLEAMRFMVGALRQGEEPDFAPQSTLADITRFARNGAESPRIHVHVADDLGDVRPSVGTAIYRMAQESITNAIRHARHATRIDVSVVGDGPAVRLTVRDDGDSSLFNTHTFAGYGLIGMAERAKLLGGTLQAGPSPDRGWTITAVLPRQGGPS